METTKQSPYHRWIKPRLENDPEFKEKIFKRIVECHKKKYNNDADYRSSEQIRINKINNNRYANDPEFRERRKEQSRLYQEKKRLLKLQQLNSSL